MSKRDLDTLDLIPYDVAHLAWKQLPEPERYDTEPPQARERHDGDCAVCGWPQGERGFVRLPFPRTHRFMGRAICCPQCWPWPFGHAQDGKLSDGAHAIAAMWDKEEWIRQKQRGGR